MWLAVPEQYVLFLSWSYISLACVTYYHARESLPQVGVVNLVFSMVIESVKVHASKEVLVRSTANQDE